MQAKISKRTVDAVEISTTDTFIWDTELKGFGLKVTSAGGKIYLVQYRMGGRDTRSQRFTIGRHGTIGSDGQTITADRARSEAERILGKIANGIDPAREKKNRISEHKTYAGAPTLSQFADIYIERHARPLKKKRSVEEDERNLRLHIKPVLGKMKLRDITTSDIAKFHAARSTTPTNANRCLALLSHMFAKAEVWGDRPSGSNPCRHVQKYVERKVERFLTDAEFAALGDAMLQAEAMCSEPRTALNAIRLLMLTGCRLEEILSLEWKWVDFDRACLRLPDSKTNEKVVPLGRAAVEFLHTLHRREGSPYVFPADRGDGHFIGIQRVWQRIRTQVELKDVRLHDLRHSFASVGVGVGDNLFHIGKVLGHKNYRTTERYAHVRDHALLAVADRASQHIESTLGRPASPVPNGKTGQSQKT